MPALVASRGHRLRLQHELVETRCVLFLPHLHEIAVGAHHDAVQHFDDVDAAAERRVDVRHLEPDDAAADDKHALRDRRQLERAGRIDDARIVRHERQLHRFAPRRDDRLLEADRLLRGRRFAAVAARKLHLEMMRIEEAPDAADDIDLARLRHARKPPGQPLHDAVLEASQLVEIDGRRSVTDAVLAHRLHFIHHGRRMQQRLRRNAADVEAHAAERGVALDEDRFQTEIRGTERGGIAAGARSRARASRIRCRHVRCSSDADRAPHPRPLSRKRARRGRRRFRCGSLAPGPARRRGPGWGCFGARSLSRSRERAGVRAFAFQRQQRVPSDTLSPTFTVIALTTPSAGDGISIVALSDSTVTSGSSAFHGVARLHEHVDHRNILKSPMSGTFTSTRGIAQLLLLCLVAYRRRASAAAASARRAAGSRRAAPSTAASSRARARRRCGRVASASCAICVAFA